MQNRINLLAPSTVEQSKKNLSENPSKLLLSICIVLVAMSVGSYGILFTLHLTTGNKLNEAQKNLIALTSIRKQIEINEQLTTEKEKTEAIISKLGVSKPKLTKYLSELNNITPTNLVLTNLTIKDSPFEYSIKGRSPSQAFIAQFGGNLQESKYFNNSIIGSSNKLQKENTLEFAITNAPTVEGEKK